jgi:hypothetical protein
MRPSAESNDVVLRAGASRIANPGTETTTSRSGKTEKNA